MTRARMLLRVRAHARESVKKIIVFANAPWLDSKLERKTDKRLLRQYTLGTMVV